MFIGNQQVNNFFEKAVANGSLAQVYCLSGVEQVGKRTLAIKLASNLLAVTPEKVYSHPDFYYLNRGVDEKSGKERKEIAVGQIRSLRFFLQNQSWQSGWRVVVIDEAEFLNEESSNALLKNLEEPGEKTLFFLLTRNDDLLLPTIRSRSEVWQLNPVSDSEIEKSLAELGCGEELAKRITYLASGRPGRAVEFYNDEGKLQEWEEEVRRWQDMWKKPLHERLKILESIVGEKDENERKETRLQKILNIWVEEGRRMLRAEVNTTNNEKELAVLIRVVDALNEAQEMLEQNINPKMVMEKIILQF